MTNLFPQQRFFAIIIFISFCLHTALFISGTVKQTAKSRVYKSERILAQLTNEFAFPMVYNDRVSLSVIASSYAKEYDINRIVIRDHKDRILVQSGIDPMLGGEDFATDITVGKKNIGHIEITLKSASNGEIIKFLWLFILCSLTIHLGVWFLYLNFSNPSEEDLQKVCDEFAQNNKPIKQKEKELKEEIPEPVIQRPRKQAPKKVLMELADYIVAYKQNKLIINDNPPQETIAKVAENNSEEITHNIDKNKVIAEQKIEQEKVKETVNEKIKELAEIIERTEKAEKAEEKEIKQTEKDEKEEREKVNEQVNRNNKIIDTSKTRMGISKFGSKKHSILFSKNAPQAKPKQAVADKTDKPTRNIVQVKTSTLIKRHHDRQILLKQQASFTKLALEFKYVDNYQLLDKVMPVLAKNYFELSSQFLQMAINQLLKDERLQGVILTNEPTFTSKGAKVELQTTTNNQKQLLLASTMLGVLYQMINQVVYNARREADMFAFNINVGISCIEQNSLLEGLTEFNERENVLLSLQYSVLKLIENEVAINKNTKQKYYYVNNMNDDLLLTLIRICNNVLEME